MNKIPSPYLSAYTPSNMSAETLETLFVQRHKLLEQSVHWLEESLLTDKKTTCCLSVREVAGKPI